MGKQAIQYRVQEETEHFLDAIDDQKGKPFDIKALLTNAVANVICAILFGRRYDYNDADFCDLVKWITENASGASFVAYSRFAKYIPGDPMHVRRSVRNTKSLSGFYKRVIEEHRNQVDGDSKRSFIDAYITEMNKEGNSENMNIDSLVRIVHEIFMAGTDTTAVTLRWALLYQMRNPDIQKTLHDEVDSVVPRDRLPELHDKAQLPILSATILETMRLSNILPLNVPHGTKYDTFFHGYDIPKNAVIIPSLMSVLSDDTLWDGDADIFCPFRFLENGDSMKKIAEFIPFSLGRRACLGEALAKTEVFLFLSAMLQRFTFLPPDGEDPPKPERVFATVTEPKSFLLRAVRRT